MSRFQVFIPGTDYRNAEAALKGVGLSDLIANACYQQSEGPDGVGVVISWPDSGDAITGYKPDEQSWKPAVPKGELKAGRYWVGIWNDRPPTPKDLKRVYQYHGGFVKLNDGNEWLIPAAKELPTNMILADDGSWKFVVQRQFHDMFNEAVKWQQILYNDDGNTEFLWADLIEFIIPAISMNYMLTDELISEMGLFDRSTLIKSLYIICGVTVGRQ